jgi:hypothetical protein
MGRGWRCWPRSYLINMMMQKRVHRRGEICRRVAQARPWKSAVSCGLWLPSRAHITGKYFYAAAQAIDFKRRLIPAHFWRFAATDV